MVREKSKVLEGRERKEFIPDHYHRPRSMHRMDLRMQKYRLLKDPRIYFGSQLWVVMRMTSQKTKYNKSDNSRGRLVVLRVYLLPW